MAEAKNHEKLNSDFKRTCRLIFGEELGELEEFEPYLSEVLFPFKTVTSFVSGKKIMISSPHYIDGARYISQDEMGTLKFPPLNINEIKDIDSLLEAAGERAIYCGNKIFGKNINVRDVDNCTDCIEVFNSQDITNTKYAAYCSVGRNSESIYGVSWFNKCSHLIRCVQCYVIGGFRSFESHCSSGISDSYYTLNCSNVTNCMFSFNLRSKNHCIGNLQLSKERYEELKKKLVSEMAEKLKRDKRLFSLPEIFLKSGALEEKKAVLEEEEVPDFVKKEFAEVTKIVLGREHELSGPTSNWLGEKIVKIERVAGAADSPAFKVDMPILGKLPASKMAPLREAVESIDKQVVSIGPEESLSLDEIAGRIAKKAVCTMEVDEGHNQNNPRTVSRFDSFDTFNSAWATRAKHSAFNSLATESDYIFGGYMRVLYSGFTINCHSITNLKNSFETDSSYKSSGCFFCHNCENVNEGLFCFNAKGLRYAVCNQQVSPEEFRRVKKILLDYINDELERKGRLEIDVFKIGARKRKG